MAAGRLYRPCLFTCALVEVGSRRRPAHGDGIVGSAPLQQHQVSDLTRRQDVTLRVVHDLERPGAHRAREVSYVERRRVRRVKLQNNK